MRVAAYESAVVRLCGWDAGRPLAGLGLLIDTDRVVTCAHVVNAALGRSLREQGPPGESDLVQVEFPLLPRTPVRLARVVTWVSPPSRVAGGDVAGLVLTEAAPDGAAPARFAATMPEPGTRLRVFGYPRNPARGNGMWADVDLKGEVGGQVLQVESRSDQTVKAQPGYSGSPVWNHTTGEATGLLQVAPFADEPERDAYLLPPLMIARAWEEPFDYLLVPENPYRGLEPFTAEQAALFFGRDADIAALTGRVRAQPVVVIVGPSGAGKSSIVQAGLIPALQAEQRWSVALVRPGQDPWPRLAVALLTAQHGQQVIVTFQESQREVARLRAEGLGPVARFLRSENRPLLVITDQFEELLATGERPDQDLLNLLLPPPEAADPAVRLVLTLRADFLPVLQSIPGFHARLNERLYLLSPMTADQMRLAVTCPASARDVSFEPRLADQVLRDAEGGSLSLLEFTLTQLWGTQRRKTLTFEGYHEMGGVSGALDRFAEERVGQLTQTAAEVLDRVLLRLVRTPGGGSGLATRQRILRSEVSTVEWEVLRRLADARLVSLDTEETGREPYAELAHDSLITAWRRLRDLVRDNASFLDWLARVRQRAAEGEPLLEARIAEARRWLSTRPDSIPADVKEFIDSSETVAEARLRESRDASDRATTARELAETVARRAEALRLAAYAELALRPPHSSMIAALALATESILTTPTFQGDLALRHVLRLHPRTLVRLDHGHRVNAVAFSPDGTRVATGCSDDRNYVIFKGWARVFDAATGTEQARLDPGGRVSAVAFSPDGTRVATGSSNGWLRVFDAATGTELARHDHGTRNPVYAVSAVAFSPDGTRIATASSDGSARVLDAANCAELARYHHGLLHRVHAVAFSPDGTRVATAGSEFVATAGSEFGKGSARVFCAAAGTELTRLDHAGQVNAVAFSPDGTRVATGSSDGSSRVFDAATGTELARLDHDDPVHAVAFSPDGTQVATGSSDGSSRVFDAATGTELARLDHDDPVHAVAFSPDGTRVATGSGGDGDDGEEGDDRSYGSRDGSSRVFDAATGTELARLDHDGPVHAVAFSPDGTRVATGSDDGSARVFEAAAGAELVRVGHGGAVHAVAFSPDGTRVATGSSDRWARVLEAAAGTELVRVGHDGPVNAVAFSPDGTRIATGSGGGTARVLEAAAGTELARFGHGGAVHAVAFSPDGTRIATVSGGGWQQEFDVATGTKLARDQAGTEVHAVAFSPDGTRVATGSGGVIGRGHGWVLVVERATGTALRLEHGRRVYAVAFSPDGTRIATASGDGSARVFDAASGTELVRLDHDGPVHAVAFSPEGTRVATGSGEFGSGDGSARVFDAVSGTELVRLDHDGPVHAVAFSPEGTRVATGSGDRSARIFTTTPDLLLRRAIDVMTRPLNSAEQRQYSLPANCQHVERWASGELVRFHQRPETVSQASMIGRRWRPSVRGRPVSGVRSALPCRGSKARVRRGTDAGRA